MKLEFQNENCHWSYVGEIFEGEFFSPKEIASRMREVIAPYKKQYKDLRLSFDFDPYEGTCIKIIGIPK